MLNMKAVVVVPTYNERANISLILDKILAHKKLHVLVVDDSSPDGTAEIVREYKKKTSRVQLLMGKKHGLGVAYKRGFAYAISEMGAEVLVEMDADGSHDPKDLNRLLEPIYSGSADFVIGSRYVTGGKIVGWSPLRYLISWGGNLVARLIAGIVSVKDCTAGFRAIKKEVVERIDWENFASYGYSFQIRLLHEAIRNGACVKEIPVKFCDREYGVSKLGFTDIKEFFFTAIELGFATYKRVLIFLFVGLIGLVLNEAVFIGVYDSVTQSFFLSQLAGISAGIISNFSLHEIWTFRDRRSGSRTSRFSKYVVTSLIGVSITLGVGALLYSLNIFSPAISHLLAIGTATISNILLSFFWAWKN